MVGELWLEGPLVEQGYFGDVARRRPRLCTTACGCCRGRRGTAADVGVCIGPGIWCDKLPAPALQIACRFGSHKGTHVCKLLMTAIPRFCRETNVCCDRRHNSVFPLPHPPRRSSRGTVTRSPRHRIQHFSESISKSAFRLRRNSLAVGSGKKLVPYVIGFGFVPSGSFQSYLRSR